MSRYRDEERPAKAQSVELGQTIEAITLDFGNTLVPFPAASRGDVVEMVGDRAAEKLKVPAAEFVRLWVEERSRQLAEDVPEGREADIRPRVARVLARLRGHPAPENGARWDDSEAAACSSPSEVDDLLETYADGFVRLTSVPPEIGPLLEFLARDYSLAIVSNWPLTMAIERYVEAAGWSKSLSAVIVSEKVGCIKPQPEIFQAAARALGVASGPRLLHVGDDLGADVGGARAVGWRSAWIRFRPEEAPVDSPLPVAPVLGTEVPDITLESVTQLPRALGMTGRPRFAIGSMVKGFELGDYVQKRYHGYGPTRIPSDLDWEVLSFLRAVEAEGPDAVNSAMKTATPADQSVLQCFAERMTNLAVRRNDGALLAPALLAMLVGGLGGIEREPLIVMPLIEDATRRIGLDERALFQQVAQMVGEPGTTILMEWLGPRPGHRDISSMGYIAGSDEDGFRYIRTW
jgi:FMN phosphatase YigB (HAD superfamily)